MASLAFEWDVKKNPSNRRRHGVSFEEAQTAFFDERALIIADPDHSDDEDRFVLLGMSATFRTLVVCHCDRRGDQVIRIISARKANGAERADYERRSRR